MSGEYQEKEILRAGGDMLIKCRKCRTYNYAESALCLCCGEKLQKVCTDCGLEAKEEYALCCPDCGKELHT